VRRGKDDTISRLVAINPSCPPEERWLWKSAVRFGALGFLDYIDAPPKIKNNPKITQLVKKELVRLLENNNQMIDTEKGDKVHRLIDEFSDNDFVISIYKNKIYKT
jgi:hypothetical protein